MKLAVIDLGTNTCNLLIAEADHSDTRIIHQSKQLVKLGDDKIKANEISPNALNRTLQAFQVHKKIIEQHRTEKIRIIATSAVRSAANKIEFLEKISESTGWIVKVISGEKEAELIFKGVLMAFRNIAAPSMILDIGGGSNEIIMAVKREMIHKESRQTGMARVINNFNLSDPVSENEIITLKNYFKKEHSNMIFRCREQGVKHLIGCSGAFDTLADIMDKTDPGEKKRVLQDIPVNIFYRIYGKILSANHEERIKMKGMDHMRVDLIVPAVILIELFISELGITRITQTDYALREGVLFELRNS